MIDSNVPEGYEPPVASRVAARAQVFITQAYRAILEQSSADPAASEAHAACISWSVRIGLQSEFEPREWALVTTPLGQLTQPEKVNASWLTEPAACLAWALRKTEIPDYETEADGESVSNALWFLDDEAEVFRAESELRSPAELESLLDLYLTLHWRLRQFSLSPGHLDFVAFARRCQWANMHLEDVRLEDNDLSIGGRPLVEVPASLWRNCLSIASERHRAAEWLLGQESTYSEVTADT